MSAGGFAIGRVGDFHQLPARVRIGRSSFFLTRDGATWRLLSTVCPHMGGTIEDCGDAFRCPNHGWAYDLGTGASINVPGQHMSAYEVQERDGILFAELPAEPPSAPRLARERGEVSGVSIQLHAHACLEIRHSDFSLLTDPWLYGPAFMGSWIHYPAPSPESAGLRPDAVWISHEHSDHFHEPTLREFDRATPIYVPDFPNRRLPRRLERLGFSEVQVLAFGERVQIAEDFHITCFEPGSLWNDAVVLVEVGGLRVLNLNDAGLNQRIAAYVAPVDIVASAFSEGASGYPLTWMHLSDEEKAQIISRARVGTLEMLRAACELYGARAILPFAGHFTLGHPSHRRYVEQMQPNSLDDVRAFFAGSDIEVIDLLPGERYDAERARVARRWRERGELTDKQRMLAYVERHWDQQLFEAAHPEDRALALERAEEYLLRLNLVPEIAFCEDLTLSLRATDEAFEHEHWRVDALVRAGHLELIDAPLESPELVIEVPRAVLAAIIEDDESWDEAHIGYWCRFHRSPDIYHAGFWRLLQAPYYRRSAEPPARSLELTRDSVIADVLEQLGDPAERVLRRHGLFCVGCVHSTADSLYLGGRAHGLDDGRIQRLVAELSLLEPAERGGEQQ